MIQNHEDFFLSVANTILVFRSAASTKRGAQETNIAVSFSIYSFDLSFHSADSTQYFD